MKFPVELFDVLPRLSAAKLEASRNSEEELTEESRQPKQSVPKGKVTRVQDPQLRAAIENHAVDRAIEYYEQLGATDFVKLGKPYDIEP